MTRMWGPTGTFVPEDAELSSDTKEQINLIILGHGHSVSDPDAFFDELDKALSQYKGFARFRQEGLPATVRKNLKKAAKVSMDLNAHINDLDGNSRQLLDQAAEGGLEGFRSHLSGVVLALHEALRRAEEYPKRGRLHEHHRIFLAADVADTIKQFIHVRPVSTRDGLFISILESVCTEAFGKESPDVYGLAQKALSYPVKIRSADGVVEYCPPPNDD